MKINKGTAISFWFEGIEFTTTVINNFCECYANNQYQFGFALGQDGHTETEDELVGMLIMNHLDGNIFVED